MYNICEILRINVDIYEFDPKQFGSICSRLVLISGIGTRLHLFRLWMTISIRVIQFGHKNK